MLTFLAFLIALFGSLHVQYLPPVSNADENLSPAIELFVPCQSMECDLFINLPYGSNF